MTRRTDRLSQRGYRFGIYVRVGLACVGALAVVGGALLGASSHSNAVATHSGAARPAQPMRLAAAGPQNQYWMVASDGGIFSFGGAPFLGSTGNIRLVKPIVGMAATPDGGGYWFVASDGGIFTEGDAGFYGSQGATALAQPIVGMARTPSGHGYWLVARDGGIFTHGDARFFGSTGNIRLAKPIVGMAATPDGGGYWFVASDGGVFAFGNAGYFGSMGGKPLVQPIVGMAATPDGQGYWLVARDGGIFSFGTAKFYGSTGNIRLAQPIVGMAATQTGHGYWFVAADGGIFAYGDAVFSGSTGNIKLAQPVVGMAGRPTLFPGGIDVSESSPSVAADGVSTMTITATVTDPGTPVPGDTLAFSVPTGGCGTLSASQRVTDLNGQASVVYTSSPTVTSSCMVSVSEVYGGLSSSAMVNQVAGAPSVMVGTPGDSSYTADQGNSGIPATFTVTDSLGHPIAGALVDFGTTLANGSVAPPSDVTDSNGSVTTTLNDVIAGDSGTVTGTVDGTSLQASTGTLTITPGALNTLTLPNTMTTQKAGTPYDVVIGASDTYGNAVNPDVNSLTFTGTATNSSPNANAFTVNHRTAFSAGQATVNVTSFDEQTGAVLTGSIGSVNGSTNAFNVTSTTTPTAISPSPANDTPVSADTMANTGQLVSFAVTDAYGNPMGGIGVTVGGGSSFSHASSPVPPTLTTGDGTGGTTLGLAKFTLQDTNVADSGKLMGTVTSTSVTASTGKITIIAGNFAKMTLTPPATPTAGTPYTVTLTATDLYGNPVQPSTTGFTFDGTATGAAPDGTHTGSASIPGGSSFAANGTVGVSVTTYLAGSDNLTAHYSGTSSFSSPQISYTVNAATYSQIIAASGYIYSGTTPTLVAVKPAGGSLPSSIGVTLTATDRYQNKVSGNTDSLTVQLSGESGDPDGGGLTGGTPSNDVTTVGMSQVLTTVTLSTAFNMSSVGISYVPPGTVPASATGSVVVSDPSAMAVSPLTINVVVTQVAQLVVSTPLTCTTTCIAGGSNGLTYFAEDSAGTKVPGALLDLAVNGLPHATTTPTAGTKIAVNSNGLLPVTISDTTAPESGTLIANLHKVPSGDGNLYIASPQISYSSGPPNALWISTSNSTGGFNSGGPSSETAGVPYTLYVWSVDSNGNPVNPTGTVTISGTALANVTNGGSSSQSLSSFTNGLATLQVTSAKAQAGATLTPSATCGVSACVQHGASFTVNPGAPQNVATAISPTAVNNTYTADQGDAGLTVQFTVTDVEGNPSPGTTVSFTHTGLTNATFGGTSASTNASGLATVSVKDHVAGDTGTVTGTDGTASGTTSPAIAITSGATQHLSFGATPTQVAGTQYTLTVSATDGFGNSSNPSWSDLQVTGTALNASPSPANQPHQLQENTFQNGQGSLTITSYDAQSQGTGGNPQLMVTCTANCLNGPSVSATFAINPAAASQVVARDSGGNVPTSETLTTPTQSISFKVQLEDPFNNVATTQTSSVVITLNPGPTADGGSLSGGGQFTTPDTLGQVQITLNLQNATQFTYTGPAALPTGGSGTLHFVDQSPGLQNPGDIAISD